MTDVSRAFFEATGRDRGDSDLAKRRRCFQRLLNASRIVVRPELPIESSGDGASPDSNDRKQARNCLGSVSKSAALSVKV
jgi:hypothetical protein